MMRRMAALLALAVMLAAVLCLMTDAARTEGAQASVTPGNAALDWAEAHETGHWYAWGGTGPSYDCSGGVMEAFGHADGIWLPHNTVLMVHSWHLYRVYRPQRGDLAFWGPVGSPYHVGFVTIWHDMAFGPLNTGTRIGWYSWAYWPPSAFYRVR